MAIFDLTDRNNFTDETVARLAMSFLEKNKAVECLRVLNRHRCDEFNLYRLKAVALARLKRIKESSFFYHKALIAKLKEGFNTNDKSLNSVYKGLAENCFELDKPNGFVYYFSKIKDSIIPIELANTLDGEKAFSEFLYGLQMNKFEYDSLDNNFSDKTLFEILIKARKLVSEENYQKAYSLLEKNLKSAKEERYVFLDTMARCAFHFDYNLMIDCANEMQKLRPDIAEPYLLLFKAHYKKRAYKEAKKNADEAMSKLDFDNEDEVVEVFLTFVKFNQKEKLLELSSRLLKVDNFNYVYNKIYAISLVVNDRRQEAIDVVKKQLAIYGDAVDAEILLFYIEKYFSDKIEDDFNDFAPKDMLECYLDTIDIAVDNLPMNVIGKDFFDVDFSDERKIKSALRFIDKHFTALQYIVKNNVFIKDTIAKVQLIIFVVLNTRYKEFEPLRQKILDFLLIENVSGLFKDEIVFSVYKYSKYASVYYVKDGKLCCTQTVMPVYVKNTNDLIIRAYTNLRVNFSFNIKYTPDKITTAFNDVFKKIFDCGININNIHYDLALKLVLYYLEKIDYAPQDKILSDILDFNKIDKTVDLSIYEGDMR